MTPHHQAIQRMCARRGITLSDLTQKTRGSREVVKARWQAMRYLKAHGVSINNTAKAFNRDRTSVLYAMRQINGTAKPRGSAEQVKLKYAGAPK